MGNFMFKSGGSMDAVKVDKDNPIYLRVKKRRDEMTGMERVDFVFTRNEYGDFTPEMHRIKDASLIAFFVGAIMGGVGRSRIAYMDFFRQNTSTAFETPLQAKKVLQDKVVIGMGSGAWRIGWRMAAFTFIYMTGSTTIAAYRGKYAIWDQVGGAGLAGFLYKFRDGPKAAFSGTIFGSLLGLTAGSISLACVKLFNMDMEGANMEYYTRLDKKLTKEKEYLRKSRESSDETFSLDKMHEMFVASMNQKKDDGSKTEASQNSKTSTSSLPQTEKVDSRMNSIESNQPEQRATYK